MSAYDSLAADSGVSRATIESIAAGRWSTVELRVADQLVAALGRPEAFWDGTLEVSANPLATAEAQIKAECCGGSLTGA